MEVHAILGKSPALLGKMIFSVPLEKIVLYVEDKTVAKKQMKRFRNLYDKFNPDSDFPLTQYIVIPRLDDRSSLADVTLKMSQILQENQNLEGDKVLFYSGTLPHLMVLFSSLNIANIMSFSNGDFTIEGSSPATYHSVEFEVDDFFTIHGVTFSVSEGKIKLTYRDKDLKIPPTLEGISLDDQGILCFNWKPCSNSRKRKEFTTFVLNLRTIIGNHSSRNVVENSVLQNWLKHIEFPFMEEEE